MGFIKALTGIPLIFLVLVFAFVNNDMATFDLWPSGIKITVSLSVAIIFLLAAGYITGWLFCWMSYAPLRRALRQHKNKTKSCLKSRKSWLRKSKACRAISKA